MISKGRLVVGKRYYGDENVSRRRPNLLTRGTDHWKHKLTPEQVIEIVNLYVPGDVEFGQEGLAKRFGVQQAAISKIFRGINWSHVTRIKRG
jgi:hypothetical protein